LRVTDFNTFMPIVAISPGVEAILATKDPCKAQIRRL